MGERMSALIYVANRLIAGRNNLFETLMDPVRGWELSNIGRYAQVCHSARVLKGRLARNYYVRSRNQFDVRCFSTQLRSLT